MTHPWVMDNKCVKYYPNPTWHWGWPRHEFLVCVHCDIDLGDMTLGQGHDTPFGHGQQLCEIISRSNFALRRYGPDTDFGYVCIVALTLEIWPSVGSRLWHTLRSWTIIVWNIIQIGQVSTELWPGHEVNRRTDRQTNRQTDRQGDSYIPKFVCGVYLFEGVY